MAIAHLTFAYASSLAGGKPGRIDPLPVLGHATASETLTGTSGTSAAVAGQRGGLLGDPIARVVSDKAIKVAFAVTPTSATPWHYLPAGEMHDYGVNPGEKMYFAEVV